MAGHNEKYVVVPTADIEESWFNNTDIRQSSSAECRTSIDGTEKIIKIEDGATVAELNAYTKHTHSEILAIVNNPSNGWSGTVNYS